MLVKKEVTKKHWSINTFLEGFLLSHRKKLKNLHQNFIFFQIFGYEMLLLLDSENVQKM